MQNSDARKISIKSMRAEQTKKNILEAAEDAFSRLGIYGARVDDIAASAGVNKRMIYEYYVNKEELYKTVLEHVYIRFNENERDMMMLSDVMNPRVAIEMLVKIYFRFLKDNLACVRMIMWENLNFGTYFQEKRLGEIRDPMKRTLHNIIARGQSMQVFCEGLDEQQILMTLFACPFNYFSNIYTMSSLMNTDFFSDEEIARRSAFLTDMLLAYMCV